MNLHPSPGDKWTLTLEVMSVKGDSVRVTRGIEEFTWTLAQYLELASAAATNGATLAKAPEEDPEFE